MLGGSFVVLVEKIGDIAQADHGDREGQEDEHMLKFLGFDGDGHCCDIGGGYETCTHLQIGEYSPFCTD
jgi:hypothetical protein